MTRPDNIVDPHGPTSATLEQVFRRAFFFASIATAIVHARRPAAPCRRVGLTRLVAAVLGACVPVVAAAQGSAPPTTMTVVGSGTATLVSLDFADPAPATSRGLKLPSFTFVTDTSGPRLNHLILTLPDFDMGHVVVASRVGDQPLPAVFRSGPLAGAGLTTPIRGVTMTTTGGAPMSLTFGERTPEALAAAPDATAPALAAAAVDFTPGGRVSVTPQVLFAVGDTDRQGRVGTAVRANVADNLTLASDVGLAGTADTAWTPLASARLVGQWARAGIETSAVRGAASPTDTSGDIGAGVVSTRDRELARAEVQPLPHLTVVAQASSSRPSARPAAAATVNGSVRVAYEGFSGGQLITARQRERTGSKESVSTSLAWRQKGAGRLAVRYVHQQRSDETVIGDDDQTTRVEVDFPAVTARCAGCLDLRAGLTAGSDTQTGRSMRSRVTGRVGLLNDTALTGETELGFTDDASQLLRVLRLTTDLPVVAATRLLFTYSYRAGLSPAMGQVFEARLLRRLKLGW
ncbi:MAG: hypothetical protein IT178_17815 [Acidobacteria bacterium]|nr:hypothetical protein [Acidobacteriota bacterium]